MVKGDQGPSTQRLMEYWAHGGGAAKVKWGVDGDFDRCVRHLSKYVPPHMVKGLCSNLHRRAIGTNPGDHSGGKHSG